MAVPAYTIVALFVIGASFAVGTLAASLGGASLTLWASISSVATGVGYLAYLFGGDTGGSGRIEALLWYASNGVFAFLAARTTVLGAYVVAYFCASFVLLPIDMSKRTRIAVDKEGSILTSLQYSCIYAAFRAASIWVARTAGTDEDFFSRTAVLVLSFLQTAFMVAVPVARERAITGVPLLGYEFPIVSVHGAVYVFLKTTVFVLVPLLEREVVGQL